MMNIKIVSDCCFASREPVPRPMGSNAEGNKYGIRCSECKRICNGVLIPRDEEEAHQ